MQSYLATRISPHISRTPEGFLIATAPIARSGWQQYRLSELDRASNDSSIVSVLRPVAEVTHPKTIASGEGKPIVSPHPSQFVSPENWSWTGKGHIQNVRVGPHDKDGNVTLVADLHIHDGALIGKIAGGTRDLSCGYAYDLDQLPDGTYVMRNIRLNHVAVVEEGRAGSTFIMDSDSKGTAMDNHERQELLNRIASGIERLRSLYGGRTEEDPDELHLAAADARLEDAAEGIDFFAAAAQFHRRDIRRGMRVEAPERRAALDSQAEEVDFFEAARSFHRRDLQKCREYNPSRKY